MPIAVEILNSDQPKLQEMLRLYFLQALVTSSNLPAGCVSFKSHWEGLAALFSERKVIEKIKETYTRQREMIIKLMLEVNERYESNSLDGDNILRLWPPLLRHNRERASAIIDSGKHVTFQFSNLEQARQAKQQIEAREYDDSEFLRALWEDERFMASFQYESRLLRPRVLTNLLYILMSVVGLRLIDKMALCYMAHRAAEDHFGCNLTDIFKETVSEVVSNNKHRFAEGNTQ